VVFVEKEPAPKLIDGGLNAQGLGTALGFSGSQFSWRQYLAYTKTQD
jgi:hypothetical protein